MSDDVEALANFLEYLQMRGDSWEAFDAERKTLTGGHAHNVGSKSAGASRKTYALSQHETDAHHDVMKRASYLAQKAIVHKDKGLATQDHVKAGHHASIANGALREVAHLHAAEVAAAGRPQTQYQKNRESNLANAFTKAREAAGAISAHAAALKMAHAKPHD